MYHVSAQGIDERMINVHYYYYYNVGGVIIGGIGYSRTAVTGSATGLVDILL